MVDVAGFLSLFMMEFWRYTVEAAPWLLLGFLIAGLLRVFVSPSKLSRHLGGRGLRHVATATLIGIPMPLCSCSVIPIGVSLYRMGASKASSLAFFISAPATAITAIMLTWGMIGWKFALAVVLVSMAIALCTGLLASRVLRDGHLEHACNGASCCLISYEGLSFKARMRKALHYGFVDLALDLAPYVLAGLALAAIIGAAVPQSIVESYMGSGLMPILAMTAIGIPIYVCSTGSIPFVAALISKGLSPAAGLAFLITGPATNISTMLAISKSMGRKALILYLSSIITLTIAMAYILEIANLL